MKLTVNGEQSEFADGITVFELLEQLNLLGQFVAVECNYSIVPYKTFKTVNLHDGDKIELVTLVGGG
ncbi:MAG: sulfur carrier protein ThiS [Planctomycetaceae bacterium]|jgi:thiamine biosynthesis protein ThiS|nr:sulfur carrier protein ThiS [Planctomycetaceae bacterium]